MTDSLSATDVITPEVRLSFPALFKARPRSAPTPKNPTPKQTFQAAFLLPPSASLKPFEDAIAAAMLKKFGKKIVLPARNNPIKNAAEKEYAGYEDGWHYISCHSDRQPAVVDQRRVPLTEADDGVRIYPGVWVRAYLNAFAWDHKEGGKGVSFGLNAVQLVRDGERLDGRRSVEQVFEALEMPEEGNELLGDLGKG